MWGHHGHRHSHNRQWCPRQFPARLSCSGELGTQSPAPRRLTRNQRTGAKHGDTTEDAVHDMALLSWPGLPNRNHVLAVSAYSPIISRMRTLSFNA